jgi:hypothetical protein
MSGHITPQKVKKYKMTGVEPTVERFLQKCLISLMYQCVPVLDSWEWSGTRQVGMEAR